MADPTKDEPRPASQEEAPPADQDVLFRLQMAASDFILGNAKYLGYLVGAVLLGALIYGGGTSYLRNRQADEFAAISYIDFKMPKVEDLARFGLAPMDDKSDATRMANVEEGARRYLAAAESSHGAAAVYAYLRAAETWRRVDKPDEALAALEKASKLGEDDLPGFTADAAYAAALLDAGKTEEGLGVYRAMANRFQGFYAERSLLMLASAQIVAGRSADAQGVLREFNDKFPQSPRKAEAAELQVRAGGSAG